MYQFFSKKKKKEKWQTFGPLSGKIQKIWVMWRQQNNKSKQRYKHVNQYNQFPTYIECNERRIFPHLKYFPLNVDYPPPPPPLKVKKN